MSSRLEGGTTALDVSWRRCLTEFKLDPDREYAPKVLDPSQLSQLQSELDVLVQIARAEMDCLYEQIAGSGYALLLADPRGVILCEKGDPNLKRLFGAAGLIVGAEWSEECEGTNGIGTCAREARPLTVHQSEHFRSRHIALSCSAAPIHDPSGQVIAVLDASCLTAQGPRESQLHTVALVRSSARLIEKCLFLQRHRADVLLRFHHRMELVDLLHDGALALSGDGRIVASDRVALGLLGARERGDLVGLSVAEVFDTPLETLLAAGHRQPTVQVLRDVRYGRVFFGRIVEPRAIPGEGRPQQPEADATLIHVVRRRASPTLSLDDVAGDDPQMIRNVRDAQRVLDRDVPILVRGPTGSGKEAFARGLHARSRRALERFVAVNCAAIPETLIESELFGYARGAFTGARREGSRGLIASASGGTLFLDEIGDMPLSMQSRLLRVLQEQEVSPLGSEAVVKVDLQVICASHRNLGELVRTGQFRSDLYYRLNGLALELPPLAERRDREALIRNCIAQELTRESVWIETAALGRLLRHDWPGNIRELRNTIRATLAICGDDVLRVEHLPASIGAGKADAPAGSRRDYAQLQESEAGECVGARVSSAPETLQAAALEEAERGALMNAIERFGGHMTRTAQYLGISRNTLYRKIKLHGIRLRRQPESE